MSTIFVDSLSWLRSKLASVLDELPPGPNRDIFFGLAEQIEEILCNFTYLVPLSDCFHLWIDAKGWILQSLHIQIQATIHWTVKKVRPKDADNVWYDTCEMMKKKEHQLIPESASKLLDVLTKLNTEIDHRKLEIRYSLPSILKGCALRDFFDWKELVGLGSSVCSCLSELEQKCNTEYDLRILLNLQKNLRDLQIFLRGLPDIAQVKHISILVGNVATRVLLVSCGLWAGKFKRFSVLLGPELTYRYLQRKISADDPKTLSQMLRLLKALRATDHSLFEKKVIEFAQYVLPHWMGSVELTREKKFLTVSAGTDLTTKLDGKNWQIQELQRFREQILMIHNFFSLSLPEDGSLLLDLLANVWLIKGEDIIIEQLTYEDGLQLSEKSKLQHIRLSPHDQTEIVNLTLDFVQEVAELLQNLSSRFLDSRMVGMCLILLKLQCFKLERKLDDYNGSFKFSIKDKVQSFQEGLKYLINCFIIKGRIDEELYHKSIGYCKSQIEARVRMVASFYHTLLTYNNITEEMIQSMNVMLSDMLDEIIMPVIAQIRQTCLPVGRTSCPKTNALGFYDSLLSKLQESINYQHGLFWYSMEEILADLQFFRHFLVDIPGPEGETQELRDLCGHVIDVAYEAEYLFESIVQEEYLRDRNHSKWCNSIWLYDLLKRNTHTKILVTKVQEKKTYDIKVHNLPQTSRHMVARASTPRIDDVVLSLNDQQELIINRLVGGYPKRDVVSIVGMPGIGKTTLAKKVYCSPTVAHHFHIRAWCCVTEAYRKREVLLEILSHIVELTENIRGMSGEDLASKLRQLLLKKKYLIVMDDIWDKEAWDDLRMTFPDDGNGSRILITSRLNDVAFKAKAHSEAHHLRLLSDAESWALLQMKIFDKECCPAELVEVGQEIAKSCKGLPLTIVAMAGILERTDREENRWKEIAKNLRSQILDDPQEQCYDILEMSYKFLPDYLKACFLYFAAFLEDKEIPVTKLIRLWIAEGFVQKTQLKSLEDLAEDYLKDLIGRSLIIFAQPRSRGGIKTCRVHDILRNFCQSKAKEDSFLRLITMRNEPYASFDDLDFLLNVNFRNHPIYETYEDHRLCFYSKRNHFIQSRPSGTLVHSLLFFATNEKYARSSYDISFISHNFKRLKVLDLECINMGPSFPIGIELMMWLKYLAVSGDVESVPSSIAKLSDLETFVLKGLKGKVDLPDTIWCLKRLRHFHVTDVAIVNTETRSQHSPGGENSSVLDCLVTISSLFLPYGENTNDMLRMFPNLRKLGCIFSESPDYYGSYNHFPRLDILSQLESLKISYYGRALHAAEFSFPLSLKKLTLSNFRLPWSHISVIGRLQNLEVVKLLSRAYDGEIWDMVEGEFCNLKFLKLDHLNVAKWNASSDNFPKLEKLVLRNCKHLEEVPPSLVEISTLKMIEVKWCGESVEDSVRRMRDEADELLNIIITSDFDSRLSL